MKSGNSRNPPPDAQGPPAGGPTLLHITLNTGRTTEYRDAELDPNVYACLQPLLVERAGAIPGIPGFAVAWQCRRDTALVELSHRGVPVVECGLAWGRREASSLWEFLNESAGTMRLPTKTSCKAPMPSMPRLPWIAEVLLPGIATLPVADAIRLGGFERCLGLALLRHHVERN
jgi:hypothetical protein